MDTPPLRCKQRLAATIPALIFGPMFMVGPVVLGLVFFVLAAFGNDIKSVVLFALGGLLAFGASAFFAYHMLQNYHWVELDGGILRGQKFWTRRLVEQRVDDITEILPLQALAKHHTVNVLIDGITGTSNRGYEIRFRSGPKLTVIRWDMTDVDGFIEAVRNRWQTVSAK
jgi:hypothetical protein